MKAISDLHFFQVLARHESMTQAAQALGLSLSAVSKRLSQLEKRLGVQLMRRTTRRLALTGEGEQYLQRGASLLQELDELESSLGDQHRALSGPLRVNATFGFGRAHVAPLIEQFTCEHPGVEVLLDLSDYPRDLLAHDLDIGIIVGPAPDSRLRARRLLASRRIACASPDYLARAGRPVTPEALARHNCLLVRERDAGFDDWRFIKDGQERRVRVSGTMSSNDGESVTRWAMAGHGIIYRSWWQVQQPLALGRLVPLLSDFETPRMDFMAVHRQQRFVPERIARFIDAMTEGLAERLLPLP
ncbi:DNA-binding transcriptional regulator, LysR family [Kushneria avicenniae]|uniref:DNA-binding transcriptional regulator, LysR family n=1 Tax=Kushneria avicenniae TaxID=402385 RepID=A0A1I1KYM9_9GAMM|nr:LysR substrate-binding domain-containing protein [Kushneria avicenniae]SFC65765.1 DNA-binding transcriptional regulator, LysR family [Kushneria avicenniae]